MKTHNNKNLPTVNTKLNFYYLTINFLKTLDPKSELYTTLKDYVKAMYFDGKHQWARKYTSKRTGLSVSAISDHNMLIEAAGILIIERKLKNRNKFYAEFLDVLAMVFGYLSSASLFIYNLTNNLTNTIKQRVFGLKKLEIPKISNKLQEKFEKMLQRIEICPPVFCPLQEAIKKEAKSLQIISRIAKLSLV